MIHISRISLRNFKSFRRISIPIPQGFTAIVGPNGSGKSNIVDGICFVLGRSSSKSLRAERFSDLIFSGAKKGKPAKKAEVSLYINNAARDIPINSKEIRISRSIDLSGNSVYRLNRKRTTRGEILDLLSAANVRPDGHNIVLQGDVTRIIDLNPVERRDIIDEIAGISEYDEKKRKAGRELEKVGRNISEASAVFKEVKEQTERLKKEKTDALRHRSLKKEIKVKRGTVLSSKHLKIKEKIEKIKGRRTKQEERAEKLQKFQSTLSIKLGARRKEVEGLNSSIVLKEESEHFSVFKEIEKKKNALKYREDLLNLINKDLGHLEKRNVQAEEEIKITKKDEEGQKIENMNLSGQVGKAEKKILNLKKQKKGAYSDLSKVDRVSINLRDKFERLHKSLDEKREELLEFERSIAILTEKNAQKKSYYEELKGDIKKGLLNLNQLTGSVRDTKAKKREVEKKSRKGELAIAELAERSEDLKSDIGKINAALQVKRENLEILNAEYRALEHIKQKRIVHNSAIDEILKLRDAGIIDGIYGTISELGRAQPEFSKALEVSAGGGLEFIVVENDRTADLCITHLKENHIGRASFLPLKNLKPIKPSEKVIKLAKKCYGFAFRLVDFDKKFEKTFAYVFRNTVVVENIDFARKAGIGGARMVTIDGDLIEPSGMMSGGFYAPSGVGFEKIDETKKRALSQKKEIEKLKKERVALLNEDLQLKKQLENLNITEVENLKEREILKERIKALINKKDDLTEYITEKEVQKNLLGAQIKELEKGIESDAKAIGALRPQVSSLGSKKKELGKKLGDSQAEKIMGRVNAIESDIFDIEKEKENIKNQIRLNSSKIDEILRPKLLSLEMEHKDISQKIKDKRRGLKNAESEIEELKYALSTFERNEGKLLREIKRFKDKRDFYIKGISRISDKKNSFGEEIREMRGGIENSNIEIARHEARLEAATEELKEFSDLNLELLVPIDTLEMEKEIAKMDAEMASLEPVNMRSIEDYIELKEKFERYDLRMEKLVSESSSIKRLIGEIEHRKSTIFMEVFENIAMNFRRIYSLLSDGGAADLFLDEEAPLDGGLQIQARPKGKNPQYIELMSGGEKTLTALSFIFAIQRYQPAPFYVFDEIDMFLDDNNVAKISDLLRESAKEAQFLVVSLKDNIMTGANQLFGVSMDSGVSKLVGVELEES